MNTEAEKMRTTPHPMALRIAQFVAEGRIIKDEWRNTDERGRDLACLLGAADPKITSPKECPVDLMPRWLAYLSVRIGENISKAKWQEIITRYAGLAIRWHVLDAATWRRCELKTKRAALMIALPHDKKNVVQPVIDLTDRSLRGDEPTAAEWVAAWAEAWAARAATEAEIGPWAKAWAAAGAAEAAARAEAWPKAWAAAGAGMAAAEAARAEAWPAAWVAPGAWDKIVTACLDAISTEIYLCEQKK